MTNWTHMSLLGLYLIYEAQVYASELYSFRHGRSKERHLYGRSKTLWGLQVFDNISWSFTLFNETLGEDLYETNYPFTTNESFFDETVSLNSQIYNGTESENMIEHILNKNIIITTYLSEPNNIKAHTMNQQQLKSILSYDSRTNMHSKLEKDAARNDVTQQRFHNIDIATKDLLKNTVVFERQKKNTKILDHRYKNPMKRYDILTEHLQIIESQTSEECTAGTSKSLGDGVVDNSRFQIEANVAVNRANMLTR